MKERPILFSAPMVRAILAGTKMQTRRILKQQPNPSMVTFSEPYSKLHGTQTWLLGLGNSQRITCPYGQPGDRLWVRETWMDLLGTGIERKTGDYGRFAYAADTPPGSYGDQCRKDYGLKWRPSIYMPRAASRITLEVTGVRVERLNDISYEDALAEGVDDARKLVEPECREGETADQLARRLRWPQREYELLWEQINGPGSWAANPWVWVVEFKRLTARAKGE